MFQGDDEYTQLLELTNVALDRDFREKSVKSLLRRIRDTDGKRNSSNFMFALQRKSPETECIMIATPKDGRIQIEKLKYAVEVLSFKLWCDPDLMSRVDLKRNSKCQFHATDTKYICINPYHLQKTTKTEKECHKRARPSSPATRPNVNLTDVRLNENYQLNFDQNYFDDDHIDDLKSPTTSNDSDFYEYSEWILTFYTLFYFRTLVNIPKYSSSHNGSSPTHQVQPNQATIYQFEHEESENWCSLKYYEYNQLVGSFEIRADHAKIQIDGFSSTNQPQRISLGAISNPFRSVKVRTCQKNIRQGQLEPYLSGVDNFYCLRNLVSTLWSCHCRAIIEYVLRRCHVNVREWHGENDELVGIGCVCTITQYEWKLSGRPICYYQIVSA